MKKILGWVRSHKWTTAGAAVALLIIFAATVAALPNQSSYMTMTSSGGSYSQNSMADSAPEMMAYDRADESVSMKAAGMTAPMPPMEPSAGTTAAESPQRLIKTAEMRLVVTSVSDSVTAITNYAESIGGYAERSSVSESSNGNHFGNVSVRVPVDKFESAMRRLRDLAMNVRDESVQGQDVTEQYTDLEARLKNARAQEQAYLEVLDKAKSVEDILKVQQYLGNVRGQIESYEGQLQYLTNRTSLSTINITLEEEASVSVPTKEFAPLEAAKNAVQALITAFQGIVIAVIWFGITGLGLLLPVLAFLFVLVWIVKRLKRNKGKKK